MVEMDNRVRDSQACKLLYFFVLNAFAFSVSSPFSLSCITRCHILPFVKNFQDRLFLLHRCDHFITENLYPTLLLAFFFISWSSTSLMSFFIPFYCCIHSIRHDWYSESHPTHSDVPSTLKRQHSLHPRITISPSLPPPPPAPSITIPWTATHMYIYHTMTFCPRPILSHTFSLLYPVASLSYF
jgi:hypothetical protein